MISGSGWRKHLRQPLLTPLNHVIFCSPAKVVSIQLEGKTSFRLSALWEKMHSSSIMKCRNTSIVRLRREDELCMTVYIWLYTMGVDRARHNYGAHACKGAVFHNGKSMCFRCRSNAAESDAGWSQAGR